jgi:hypothetical protein
MKGTIEVSIRDEYQVFVAKLKHDNFYNPHELVVLKNTIGSSDVRVQRYGRVSTCI